MPCHSPLQRWPHVAAASCGRRCLIADDSAAFVDAARGLLERQGIAVVGVASSGAEAVRRFIELRPDVILVDINLGAESGFDVVDQLTAAVRGPAHR
jgi:CheY-like chemotaxis protein